MKDQRLGFFKQHINGLEVITPPLCQVPDGPFLMGSDKQRDPLAQDDEMPQHTVIVATFFIAKYPVTVAEYACAVRAKAVPEPRESGKVKWQRQLRFPDHPVVGIHWKDAIVYSEWLSRITGMQWRLPTEAEWEKAARGTTGQIFPWGDQWDTRRANTSEAHKGTTTPVGAFPNGASPYGAQDMVGNVWEWCSSLFMPYPYRSDDGRENPDLAIAKGRILRGGSWYDIPTLGRAAYRDIYVTDLFFHIRGFRLACNSGTEE